MKKENRIPENARKVELQRIALDSAKMGATSTLEPMLRAGMPANLSDSDGNTLIMLAAYHDHPDTVECLAYYGAEVDRRNGRGQTPLAGAAFKGYMDCARILIHYGADPEAPQGHGQTPVSFAAMFGRKQMLVYLQSVAKRHPFKNILFRMGVPVTRMLRRVLSPMLEARSRKRLRWAVHY